MEKNLYIDASHPNETRVVLKSGENIEDYEYEGVKNNLIKNNIYLGKVSRIEPSLQAAFVDFGRERHGFLSFNDIQSDYYQIPKSDLEIIKQEEEKVREELSKEVEAMEDEWFAAIDRLKKIQFIDSEHYLARAIKKGKKVLAEGAQGSANSVVPKGKHPVQEDLWIPCASQSGEEQHVEAVVSEVFVLNQIKEVIEFRETWLRQNSLPMNCQGRDRKERR